ncbi:MAG: RluA family pseudouridine synthase [Spirochaetales bacterium]|nr:RluA family pseudouridine synthase [Spirochaetales bacterium]
MKQNNDYSVIYSDDDIVVFNKRSGLLIAADRYDPDAPRLDVVAEKEFGKLFAVHRIDKDTSGLVIYAKNAEAHKALSKQFEERTVEKTYHCLVNGHPTWDNLTVSLPLQPDGDDRHRTVVNKRFGKPSKTDFENLGSCGPFSWIIAHPHTGRTHQIRAHLQTTGFPIVCDPLYSGNQHPVLLSDFKRKYNGDPLNERPLLNRLALHAYSISINHPKTNERMSFNAPYPRDMEAVRKQLAKLFKVNPIKDTENNTEEV